jgi:hypothetical protein
MTIAPLSAIAALVLLTVSAVSGCESSAADTSKKPAVPFAAQLGPASARIVARDGTLFPLATADHELGAVCVVEPFGIKPAKPAQVSDVTTVYGWALCAEKVAGGGEGGENLIAPAVFDLTHGRVTLPRDGEDTYGSDLKRLFPGSLRAYAEASPIDLTALQSQLDALLAH